ncbi:MAG: ribulose-phosphate 3-epimerase [Thermoleophilia bacterium]|nr:ribulose-phosphate 3-epimerase [Thermoleophilia bacterium]
MAWRDWVRPVEIEPSLYAADFARLGEQIEALLHAGTRIFHFDVGDGHFVEPITIGPVVLQSIAPMIHAGGAHLDVHLMVSEPDKHIPQVARAGGDSVTFHLEADGDPGTTIGLAREHGLGVGVAFKPATPVHDAASAAQDADLCLCMSIEPGYSGQEFRSEALGRIRELRGLLPDRLFVQVDGGISSENVRQVHEAGASLVVAGSSIFGGKDLAQAYGGLVQALA